MLDYMNIYSVKNEEVKKHYQLKQSFYNSVE